MNMKWGGSVVSDGNDNASQRTEASAIAQSSVSNAAVDFLDLSSLENGAPKRFRKRDSNFAQTITEVTGGERFRVKSRADFARDFARIGENLNNLYLLQFQSPDPGVKRRLHKLQLETSEAGVHLRAPAEYDE